MKKEYWHVVLTAGFILGILYSAQTFLSYAFYGNKITGWIASLIGFASIVWVLINYGKKAAAIKDPEGMGYSYGQAFGFSIIVLLLSGIIVGISQWLLQNVIDPEFYAKLYKEAAEQMVTLMPNASDEQIKAMQASQQMMRQMWAVIGASMISMLMLGGLVALATSVVIKRKPSI